jgi:hypothetical protein
MSIHALYVPLVSQEILVHNVLLVMKLRPAMSVALDTTQVEEEFVLLVM